MDSHIPQWITQAFVRSAVPAGASASKNELEACAERLLGMWSSPERHFHDVRHLAGMLARIDTLAPEMQDAHLVRLAAWGHGLVFNIEDDAVYSRNGGEDEKASAEVASTIYASIGIPEEAIARIAKLISSLRKRHDADAVQQRADETARFTAIDVDQFALYDAHFGTLSEDPQRYKSYTESVRAEYPHVPQRAWLEARREIVSHLLGRKKIYLSPLASAWEAAARQNLTAELGRLDAKLADSNATHSSAGSASAGSTSASSRAGADRTGSYSDLQDTSEHTAQIVEKTRAEKHLHSSEGVAPAAQGSNEGMDEDGGVDNLAQFDRLAVEEDDSAGRSSLEHLDDMFVPGAPPRILTHDQREAARRVQISQDTIDAIEERRTESQERRDR